MIAILATLVSIVVYTLAYVFKPVSGDNVVEVMGGWW